MDEIYRTDRVKVAQDLQNRYGFPEEMPVVVWKTGVTYRILMVSPVFSAAGDSLIRPCYEKIQFGHDTEESAIEAAKELRDGLSKILSEK